MTETFPWTGRLRSVRMVVGPCAMETEQMTRKFSHVSKVEGGVHGREEVSKRRAALPAISPVTARRDTAPPPELTRDKV